MSREKKKGTSGNAKAFITRAKALKKLQLTQKEFRRLCILKGVYPRDPRKKLEGSDKTYYLRKDIDFLAHERLISTLRHHNAHKKKEVKARAKRRIDVLKRLALSKPKARLDHLVVERYPHFTDAVRELDDPLCVVTLFANLPADHKVGISPARVAACQRLVKEFHHFVAETGALKRVFVSIKGYYFQAKVAGELVTWITPHRFTQILPADVDYSVMLTFLELYECILSFVNFKLYTGKNLAYPPKISRVADAKGLELASVQTEKLTGKAKLDNTNDFFQTELKSTTARISDSAVEEAKQLALAAQGEEEEDEEEDDTMGNTGLIEDGNDEAGSGVGLGITDDMAKDGVFTRKSFVLGREVPYTELEFVLKASGAVRVVREDNLPEESSTLSSFTHWIIDRPKVVGERNMALEYVQPQYVFDSVNAGVSLPTSLYGPGSNLPPHLSPFVTDEDDGGYRPWFKDVLDRIKAGDSSVVAEAAAVVYAEAAAMAKKKASAETNASGVFDGNLNIASVDAGEGMGNIDDDVNAAGREDVSEAEIDNEEDEEGEEEEAEQGKQSEIEKEGKEMATLMLSRKKMRLYERQQRVENAKINVKDRLMTKRKHLEAERAQATLGEASKKRRKQ